MFTEVEVASVSYLFSHGHHLLYNTQGRSFSFSHGTMTNVDSDIPKHVKHSSPSSATL